MVKYILIVMALLVGNFNACATECDHVEPCFSYAPPFAQFTVVDSFSNEPVLGVVLQVEGAGAQGICDVESGVCTVDYTHAGTIHVEISKEGYQVFSADFEVQKEPDISNGGCHIEGCLMNNIPPTVSLVPNR